MTACFPPTIGNKARVPAFTTLTQRSAGLPAGAVKQEKKRHLDDKRRNKTDPIWR